MVQVEPTGSLTKRMGCERGHRPEAVMVDDLGDGDLVGAGHGLGELVVVHQHEAGGHGLEQVGLGEDAEQGAVLAGDHHGVRGAWAETLADVGDAAVGVQRVEVAGRPARSIVAAVRTNQAVVAVSCGLTMMLTLRSLGEGDDGGIDREVAADDDGADAELDGALLDVTPVADDDDGAVPAGMLSFSEIFQKVPTSMAPMRTKSSSRRSPSTRWSTEARSDWTMRARLVRTLRMARGSSRRGMKKWPSCASVMVPVARLSEETTGRTLSRWLVDQAQGLGAGGAQADGDRVDRHQVAHARGYTSLR